MKKLLILCIFLLCLFVIHKFSENSVTSVSPFLTQEEKNILIKTAYNSLDQSLQNKINKPNEAGISGYKTLENQRIFKIDSDRQRNIQGIQTLQVTFPIQQNEKGEVINVFFNTSHNQVLGFNKASKY